MNTVHQGLTISTKIKAGKKEQVLKLLDQMNAEGVGNNSLFPFGKLKTTHFVSWVIIPEEVDPYGKALPERLMLLTSFTGTKKKHIDEVVNTGAVGLKAVYRFCEQFPEDGIVSDEFLTQYLYQFSIRSTFYTGFQYVTYEEVRQEHRLQEAIQQYLDEQWKSGEPLENDPVVWRRKIQDFVRSRPEFSWAIKPYRRSWINFIVLFGPLLLVLLVLAMSIVLSLAAIFTHTIWTITGLSIFTLIFGGLIILLLLLRIDESRPFESIKPVSYARIHEIVSREKHIVKNELTVVGAVKKGFIRRFFLAFTLRFVSLIRGLGYIPTVHTARWLQDDEGRRIIFIANFDNTSEGYAHDFVDSKKRTRNLNLIFGHGRGFPPTRYAVLGGGKDRKQYITAVRANQKITQLWYSTFPNLSILNIDNNHEIRKGLFGKLKTQEIEDWLLRF